MQMLISAPTDSKLHARQVELPLSKSIVNRLMVLAFQRNLPFPEPNYASQPNDIRLMRELLLRLAGSSAGSLSTYQAEDAGTVYRFLTALMSFTPGIHELLGSRRMTERPMAPLVEELRRAGADIKYLGKTGYPPLLIQGVKAPDSFHFVFSAEDSSQFISACLLISPSFSKGIQVTFSLKQPSFSYIHLTLQLLELAGCLVESTTEREQITYSIRWMGPDGGCPDLQESDWSSAAFLYALSALLPHDGLILSGLRLPSLQGDSTLSRLFSKWGVRSELLPTGIRLTTEKPRSTDFYIDFSSVPDLAPPLIVYSALKGMPLQAAGLEHLRMKESDRIEAMRANLNKIGFDLSGSDGLYNLHGELRFNGIPEFDSFNDHRIAMSFALCATRFPVRIKDPQCVVKSFPRYWDTLRDLGFIIEY